MTRTEVIGDATLILGDSTRWLEAAPSCFRLDCVIADPPYGIDLDYRTYNDTPENLDCLIANVISRLAFSTAKRTLVFCSHSKLWKFPPATWIGCVNWNTTGSYGKLGVCQWMPFLFYGEDLAGFGSINGQIKSDTISISGGDGVGFRRGEQIDHPCPKPTNLMRRLVSRFSEPSETILDPFMGSGTTGVACANLGRKFIGIEIDPGYFDIACRRIEEAYKQPRLFEEPIAKPVQDAML